MSAVQTNGARNSGSDGEGGTVGAEAKGYQGGYTGGADATRSEYAPARGGGESCDEARGMAAWLAWQTCSR